MRNGHVKTKSTFKQIPSIKLINEASIRTFEDEDSISKTTNTKTHAKSEIRNNHSVMNKKNPFNNDN